MIYKVIDPELSFNYNEAIYVKTTPYKFNILGQYMHIDLFSYTNKWYTIVYPIDTFKILIQLNKIKKVEDKIEILKFKLLTL